MLMIISRLHLFRMRNISDKICTKETKIRILWSIIFPRKSWRLWDNVQKYCRARQAIDGNIIRRMRFSCWIRKEYKHTLIIFNTYYFSTATAVRRMRLGVAYIILQRTLLVFSLFSSYTSFFSHICIIFIFIFIFSIVSLLLSFRFLPYSLLSPIFLTFLFLLVFFFSSLFINFLGKLACNWLVASNYENIHHVQSWTRTHATL
jgi:hypothetical protein